MYLLDKSVKAINKVPIQKDNSPLTLWKYTYPTYTSTHPNRSTSKSQFSQKYIIKLAIIIKAVKIINISVDIYLRVIFRHLSMLQHSYDI